MEVVPEAAKAQSDDCSCQRDDGHEHHRSKQHLSEVIHASSLLDGRSDALLLVVLRGRDQPLHPRLMSQGARGTPLQKSLDLSP